MRILMLAQFYPPTVGGEERHVHSLSTALAERGHDVAVATLWHEGLPEFECNRGVRIYRIRGTVQRAASLFSESGRRHAPPFPDPELALSLRRIVRMERPNIVHAHNWLVHSFLPLKPMSGAKLVVTLHDYSLVCVQKRLMYHDRELCSGPGMTKCLGCAADHYGPAKGATTVFANWLMGAVERGVVDLFLPVSQAVVASTGLASRRLPFKVIPNFVPDKPDSDQANVVQDAHAPLIAQLPPDGFLLFVGDLTRDKGINILLQAYAGLADVPPLVLLGRSTSAMPTELPENVIALGPWPHEAVMRAWQRSSVGLLPSLTPETFGIVVIEAMANGRPVIASRIGGLPDVVVEGETGFLVPPGDATALRDRLARLLADPQLCERMGQAAKRRVSEYTAGAVVPRIEAAYEQIVCGG